MKSGRSVIAIVVAAGIGARANGSSGVPKQYQQFGGKAVLSRTIEALLAIDAIGLILPVIHPGHQPLYDALKLANPRLLPPVHGGATRQTSVLKGLQAAQVHAPELVLVHDAARPFVSQQVVAGVLAALDNGPAALPVLGVTDTIKRSRDGRLVSGTEDRGALFSAQTPQGFAFPAILDAHERAAGEAAEFTDDAAIAEWAGFAVAMTEGSADNIKITRPEDFARAEGILAGERRMETRVGTGYDVHSFEPGDFVTLCGVEIPYTARLNGHSDADVALHALSDAIYGALGEGDIGSFFPPSDPQWKGAPSRIFLAHAAGLVRERGGRIVNLDITLVCEAPRIGPHVQLMRETVGAICGIPARRVAVKATTNEKLGFIGREEGIVSLATATLELPEEA